MNFTLESYFWYALHIVEVIDVLVIDEEHLILFCLSESNVDNVGFNIGKGTTSTALVSDGK